MARYTVTWHPATEQRLAELWMAATNRDAMTAASHEVDTTLGADPYSVGESRFGRRRVWFVPPLVVIYDVHDDDRLVLVKDIGTC